MSVTSFTDLGLAEPINRALNARNHIKPTAIQARAIPELKSGKDLLGIAQTGTGKTGAFALPILHQLCQKRGQPRPFGPRVLVLAPTRELAIQIGAEFHAYSKFLSLRQAVIFGGISQRPQVKALTRGVDIVVATPGRLLDLMNQRKLRLDAVEHLVIDEADRMLDMGFVRDVRKIVATLPKARQSMLFSATMPNEIAHLSAEILSAPIRVEVAPQATPVARIEQRLYHVEAAAKRALLQQVLADPALSRVIVFARTKHRASRLAEQLEKTGISADSLHGNKSQNARQRALARFRSGNARVLVATDIAARGIDIEGVSHVINYELPNESESYVHRIGRTARAGAHGVALSFCDKGERGYLRGIEKLIGNRLQVVGEIPEPARPKPSRPAKSAKSTPWAKRGKPSRPHKAANDGQNPVRRRRRAA